MIKSSIGLLLVLLSNTVMAQSATPPCHCCTAAYKQFNFWLGDWDVLNAKGEKVGENSVLSMQDGCLLQENWTTTGQTGTSYNFYNPADSIWKQVYIDNTGTILELKGKLKLQKMVLVSEQIKSRKGGYYYNRITWSADSLGNVRQLWDIVSDKDSVLQVAFDGLYVRKKKTAVTDTSKKVTGIGGVFFKSKNPGELKEWYQKHLGLAMDAYGTNFEWRQGDDSTKYGFTQWSAFNEKTTYFKPSEKEFMINYRVKNLEWLAERLKKEGVVFTDTIETYDYGKFVHILDIEGNKIELWEPNDEEYNKIVGGRTK